VAISGADHLSAALGTAMNNEQAAIPSVIADDHPLGGQLHSVPEPASVSLLALGALCVFNRRQRRQAATAR
jgi:hypothetical protein